MKERISPATSRTTTTTTTTTTSSRRRPPPPSSCHRRAPRPRRCKADAPPGWKRCCSRGRGTCSPSSSACPRPRHRHQRAWAARSTRVSIPRRGAMRCPGGRSSARVGPWPRGGRVGSGPPYAKRHLRRRTRSFPPAGRRRGGRGGCRTWIRGCGRILGSRRPERSDDCG